MAQHWLEIQNLLMQSYSALLARCDHLKIRLLTPWRLSAAARLLVTRDLLI
jgi:hypothetical protein